LPHNSVVKWDYAAEDGDYVQVLVDGSPITDPVKQVHFSGFVYSRAVPYEAQWYAV